MSDLRFNSIAGATLASVLGILGLGVGADILFHPHYPEKPAIEIAGVEAGGEAGGAPAQAAAAVKSDWGRLFADPTALAELVAKGEKVHGVCKSCHTFEKGGANGTGPNLYGVFGRAAAAYPGFKFSQAMQDHKVAWSYDTLDEFLTAPGKVVKGTAMSFAGVKKQADREALIAYLRSLSDSPAPLPASLPEAAPAEAAPADAAAAPAEAPKT